MVTTDHTRPAAMPSSWADPTPTAGILGPDRPAGGTPRRDVVPLLAWGACLAVAIVLLVALGGGRLAAPALTAPSTWASWAAAHDPFEVAMVVARLGALGLAWYLAGVTSISVLARLLRAARLVRVADALSVGPVRMLVQQALGVGLATGVVLSVVPSAPPHAPGAAAVTSAPSLEPSVSTPVVAVPVLAAPEDPLRTGPPEPALSETPAPVPSAAPSPVPSPVPSPPMVVEPTTSPAPAVSPEPSESSQPPTATGPAPTVAEVTVRAGDHFWSLAESAVASHLGRAGTEQEVAAHWRTVVDANADRLVVPGNPDLLLPGQVVLVPSPGGEVGG